MGISRPVILNVGRLFGDLALYPEHSPWKTGAHYYLHGTFEMSLAGFATDGEGHLTDSSFTDLFPVEQQ